LQDAQNIRFAASCLTATWRSSARKAFQRAVLTYFAKGGARLLG